MLPLCLAHSTHTYYIYTHIMQHKHTKNTQGRQMYISSVLTQNRSELKGAFNRDFYQEFDGSSSSNNPHNSTIFYESVSVLLPKLTEVIGNTFLTSI